MKALALEPGVVSQVCVTAACPYIKYVSSTQPTFRFRSSLRAFASDARGERQWL